MNTTTGFIIKVFLLSLTISIFIKYIGPYFTISATNINALLMVLIPPLVIPGLLIWQTKRSEN